VFSYQNVFFIRGQHGAPKTFSLKDFPPGFDTGDEQLNKVYFLFLFLFLFLLHFLSRTFLPGLTRAMKKLNKACFLFSFYLFLFSLKDFPPGR